MRFVNSVFALGVLVAAVFAADNPIIKPDGKDSIVAGKPCIITWTPTTGSDSMITLTLRKGLSTNLKDVEVIIGPIKNTGSYTWNVQSDLESGSNYAIMITSPAATQPNYTPLLAIEGSSPKPESTSSTTSSYGNSSPKVSPPKVSPPKVSPPKVSPPKVMPTPTAHYPYPVATGSAYHGGNSTYGYLNHANSTTNPKPYSTGSASPSGSPSSPGSYGSSNSTTSVPPQSDGAMGSVIFNPMVLVACFVGIFVVSIN